CPSKNANSRDSGCLHSTKAPAGLQTRWPYALLRDHLVDDIAKCVSQLVIATQIEVAQLVVVDAEQPQHRRIEVVGRRRFPDHVVVEIIRLTVVEARLDSTTSQPPREVATMMIPAPRPARTLGKRCAPELAAAHHQRVFQHTALLEIPDQGGRRLVVLQGAALHAEGQLLVMI